jgi:hypothetical protein
LKPATVPAWRPSSPLSSGPIGARPDGVAGQAFVEGTLAFLDVLRGSFLQHREVGGGGDKCGGREKRSFHFMFPI